MKSRLRPLLLVFFGCLLQSGPIAAQPRMERVWQPATAGVIVIEPEEASPDQFQAGSWEIRAPWEGAAAAVSWRGPTQTAGGQNITPYETVFATGSVLRFLVAPDNTRFWRLRLLNFHLKEDGDNDVWASFDGADWSKFHDPEVATWTWDNSGFGTWNRLIPARGQVHRLELAGRSRGFSIDRVVLHATTVADEIWQDHQLVPQWQEERLLDGQRYLWSTAPDLGGGWRYLEGLGWLYDASHPWVYHWELGWLYSVGTSLDNVFLYRAATADWLWTTSSWLPWLYSFSAEAWLTLP